MRIPAAALLLFAAAGPGAFAAATDIVEGNPGSSVKVQLFEDLQCSDCARFSMLLDEKILPKYGSRVAFIHRDFPLPRHDWARQAAIAARWVYLRNAKLGLTFRRELFAEQVNITAANLKPWLLEFAARNNLDQKGILDSLDDHRLVALVEQDRVFATARGVSKVPTVQVGGVSLTEPILYEDVERALDEALGK
jgi:protein-disulfide isomerase